MIPMEYVQKLKKALVFRISHMRQLSFGLLDMGWHGQDPTAITDVKALKPNNLQPQNYTLK
jgi:peptidyl-dipeptidase Dcp